MKRLLAGAALLLGFQAGTAMAEAGEASAVAVHFNVINKISGRTTPLKILAGEFSSFDKLQIFPSRCVRIGEGGGPAYAVLLEVYETSLSKTPVKLFSGWLFSESHSLTNVENQYYDLLLKSCDLPEAAPPETKQAITPPPDTPPAASGIVPPVTPETNDAPDLQEPTPLD